MSPDRRDVLYGTLGLMILKTLEALGPLHGYLVARRIEQISGNQLALNQGTLYPALLKQDAELQREIAAHLDEATDDYIERGLAPADARRAALIDFCGVARTEDAFRDDVSFRWLSTITRDIRHAGRSLRRNAGFACVVILVLAIGVGASTAIFVLLNSIVLRPLALPDSNRLVAITHLDT
jgi:hypothetical protein